MPSNVRYWSISNFANAYKNCSSLYAFGADVPDVRIDMPSFTDSVTEVNLYHAFDNCRGLTYVGLPDGGNFTEENVNITGMLANKNIQRRTYIVTCQMRIINAILNHTGFDSIVSLPITWEYSEGGWYWFSSGFNINIRYSQNPM